MPLHRAAFIRAAAAALCMLCFQAQLPQARADSLVDATGDRVELPANPARVLPAGPPAAILLAAVAPDLMLRWPHQPDPDGKYLSTHLAKLTEVPRLSGRDADVTAILTRTRPDLVVDYGDTAPRYAALARHIRAAGTPALLIDGSLDATPAALRLLGRALHRQERAEMLARLAEAILARPASKHGRTAMYLRGDDALLAAAPDSTAAAVFRHLGMKLLAPPGTTPFRPVTAAEIARLDPDMLVFGDPDWRAKAATDQAIAKLRAARSGGLLVAPALPFEVIAEPPSLNRLLGLAWLSGASMGDMFALFSASFYDRVADQATLARISAEAEPIFLGGTAR